MGNTDAYALSPRETSSQVLRRLLHTVAFRLQEPLHTGVVAELLLLFTIHIKVHAKTSNETGK